MKYVWSSEGYMFEDSDCGMLEAKDDFDVVIKVLGVDEDLEDFVADVFEIDIEPGQEIKPALKKKIIQQLKDDNGDGQPYFTIKNENGKVIFGG